jgi:hypothetical protein
VTLENDEVNGCESLIPNWNGNAEEASCGLQVVVTISNDLNLNDPSTLEVEFHSLRDYDDCWGLSECGYDESTHQTD